MNKIVGLFVIVLVICFAAYKFQASESEDVMAFGDSLTYGKGDKDGEGYVEGLEDELNNPDSEKKSLFGITVLKARLQMVSLISLKVIKLTRNWTKPTRLLFILEQTT
ncbi:hypothetical protein NGI46_08870 [Peribacillus butanolivorans]|uniref:hypothetical protein n=1 Tax=Peribacillus butanolivorans TaxID=421767 RepID=UPI00207CD0E6|nr:hypothetical protein [Peribacillus butanolivorans]MCO0597579.1 hypothetical protein [Peribacillus butanolivorans]